MISFVKPGYKVRMSENGSLDIPIYDHPVGTILCVKEPIENAVVWYENYSLSKDNESYLIEEYNKRVTSKHLEYQEQLDGIEKELDKAIKFDRLDKKKDLIEEYNRIDAEFNDYKESCTYDYLKEHHMKMFKENL